MSIMKLQPTAPTIMLCCAFLSDLNERAGVKRQDQLANNAAHLGRGEEGRRGARHGAGEGAAMLLWRQHVVPFPARLTSLCEVGWLITERLSDTNCNQIWLVGRNTSMRAGQGTGSPRAVALLIWCRVERRIVVCRRFLVQYLNISKSVP